MFVCLLVSLLALSFAVSAWSDVQRDRKARAAALDRSRCRSRCRSITHRQRLLARRHAPRKEYR